MQDIISDADIKEFVEFFDRHTQFWKRKTFLQLVELARSQKLQLDQVALEEAALKSAQNAGHPTEMFDVDGNQIMRDGALTEYGVEFIRLNSPITINRNQLLQAFAKALGVSDASGWSTGQFILRELFAGQPGEN